MNLDFREFQGLARKANPENQGPGENPAKTARRGRRGAWASLETRGTPDSPAARAPRERKEKLAPQAHLAL